ncbi:class a rhodopsin G-protein coupled receptor gprop2 [Plakobranchus ocellatus]|uniref:Class a rhodopsin G-protein coupled receptor gprop2 n=1 Tax=Plakobranchus ocellatus TaxID=259542 RepID=A0AAV4DF97_9GAST|nr:class a rhodopsin G-protein coupled receptor gprop2 [Plakobranchus ocellatus]
MTTDTQVPDSTGILPTIDPSDLDSDMIHDLASNGSGNEHFRSMSDAGYTFIATMLTVTFVLGSFINGLCLFVFARNKRLRSPTNVFVIALNLCDFFMCFCGKCILLFPTVTFR